MTTKPKDEQEGKCPWQEVWQKELERKERAAKELAEQEKPEKETEGEVK